MNDPSALQQTMLSELPQQLMQQVAQASQNPPPMQSMQGQQGVQSQQGYPYTSQPPHVSTPPHISQPPNLGPPHLPTPHPPHDAAPRQRGLWALVAVGMVLFVFAALFVMWRLA